MLSTLFLIINTCGIKTKTWMKAVFFVISTAVYVTALTIGYSNIFYVGLPKIGEAYGASYLYDKHYGFMHTVFYVLVGVYYLIIVAAIVYSFFKKKQVPRSILILISIAVTIAMIGFFGARLITIHHNVERDYLRDNGKERPITFRYPYNYYARKSERECLLNSDVNLTLSKRDAEEFASWYPSRNLHLHSIGIMEYRQIADREFVQKPRGRTFAITGSLCYGQSLVSIVDFLRRYYDVLRKVCPGARIIIAGRNPSPVLYEECKGREDIEIVPNPKTIAEVVSKADYYICPIFAGSGIKLRVLDALKQGLPVLCHDVSVAGYESFVDKGILFPYSDTASFEASLRRMLCSEISSTEIYQSFRQYFSLEAGAERLRKVIQGNNEE